MDAHEYICIFSKFEYFMYFWLTGFMVQFFSDSGPVHIFGVNRFNHQSSSDNIGSNVCS
jgi:hypothetical protein